MRLLKIMGLCLVAAFALAAATAGAASAELPALYQCGAAVKNAEKHYTGGYDNKTCSTVNAKHEGKYEFEEWRVGSKETGGKKGKVKKFKSKGKHPANLEVYPVGGVACTDTVATGEFSGPKNAKNINVTFTGCKFSSISCHSEGAAAGEIKTNPLVAEIGYLNKATKKVGFDIKAETGTINAIVICGGLPGEYVKLEVTGSAVGEVVSPVNVFTNLAVLEFEQTFGKQKWTKLEGMPEDVLFTGFCKSIGHVCATEETIQSGESTRNEGKGETLELKA
jgi:hypothetical protein